MPTYVYRVIRSAGPGTSPRAGGDDELFEVRQSIHDPPLTVHPGTGEPVRRVPCPPIIARGPAGNGELANAGFTKYKRTSDGSYEKQAGTGPGLIDPRKL